MLHPTAPIASLKPKRIESPCGTRIDNYDWLRDDTRRDPQVLNYLEAENAYTESVMQPILESEQVLFKELTDRLPPDETSVPVLDKGYWYFSRFSEGDEYPVYLRRRDGDAIDEVLLDVNQLAQGHEFFDLGSWDISPDGQWLAYTFDAVGRRQYSLRILNLANKTWTDEGLNNIEADLVWAGDSTRLLYLEKDPKTLLSLRVKAHTRGQDSAQDVLLYEETDKSYYLSLTLSRSEDVIFLCCSSTEQTQWWYAMLNHDQLTFQPVLPRQNGHEYDLEHFENYFLIRTNWNAPNFKICLTPVGANQSPDDWQDLVAHRDDQFIEDFEPGRHHLAVSIRRNGNLTLDILTLDAHLKTQSPITISPPEGGVVHLIGTPDIDSTLVRYMKSSLRLPAQIYDFDLATQHTTLRKSDEVRGGFLSDNYRCERHWARAKDGASIPVTLAYRQDTPRDGSAPGYLYGYGAYGYAIDPDFDDSWVSLMDRGFVVAIAHVRGGQEMGRHWYDSGRLRHKMNSFTDFIDVRNMLVDSGLVHPQRVCAQGGSAGGLLVGAVANMAPQAFCAIVAHVPFVDVVTTMLDDTIPLTSNEYDQWGNPSKSDDYHYMLSYSPYDNVKQQAYPAMLIFTALWDSQVQYFEPAKWVAKLRAHKTDQNPLLLQTDLNAGHGGKSGRYDAYRDTAREFAFLLWQVRVAGERAQVEQLCAK